MLKIKKGDIVEVKIGNDKHKRGKVLHIFPKKNKLVVENVNLKIKHIKPKRAGEKGQKVQFPAPIYISKVSLVCPKCDQAVRVGFKILADKKKVRICKKCQQII